MITLKRLRLLRGWSQAELARRSGVNANTISLIESRRFRPYKSQLQKVAAAFGLPREDAGQLVAEAGGVSGGHFEHGVESQPLDAA